MYTAPTANRPALLMTRPSFTAGLDVNVIYTTRDTGGQLRTERVSDTVFGLGGGRSLAVRSIDTGALLAVDGLTGDQVLSNKEILRTASNEDTSMSVGLGDNLSTTLCNSSATSSAATGSTTASRCTTATSVSTATSTLRPPPRPPPGVKAISNV